MPIRNEVLVIFSALIGVLLAASASAAVLRARHTGSAAIANLNDRIQAWWRIVALLGAALLFGASALTAVFSLLSFLALREFLTISAVETADRRATLACFLVALPAQYSLVALGWPHGFTLLLPVGAMIALPMLAAVAGNTRNFLARSTEMYFGLMVCVYGVSHVPALLMLDIPGFKGRQMLLVMFVLVIAQASDVLQYICGKLFGRRLLAPKLSPGKTVEGFAGGLLCATALGAGLWWITPFTVLQAGAMAFVIVLTGAAGGLVLSAVKRDRGVKDWSQFVPGHGGVLDRLDSLCYSSPVFFHLTKMLLAQS